jgi:hypothetical protein
MKTTLTINTTVDPSKLHGAMIYKNGTKYATLDKAAASQPWTDDEEAKHGDRYSVIVMETPKQLPTNIGGVMVNVEEHTHGLLSEPFLVTIPHPTTPVAPHNASISGETK